MSSETLEINTSFKRKSSLDCGGHIDGFLSKLLLELKNSSSLSDQIKRLPPEAWRLLKVRRF